MVPCKPAPEIQLRKGWLLSELVRAKQEIWDSVHAAEMRELLIEMLQATEDRDHMECVMRQVTQLLSTYPKRGE